MLKNVIKLLLSVILIFGLIGCGNNIKNENYEEAVQYGKWLKPSKTTCEENGGVYDITISGDKEKVCEANLENAKKICNDSGGFVPSIEDLKEVVIECGGEFRYIEYIDGSRQIESGRTTDSQSYITCIREKGFFGNFPNYLSSTTVTWDSSLVWYIKFSSIEENYYDINNSFYVMCITE